MGRACWAEDKRRDMEKVSLRSEEPNQVGKMEENQQHEGEDEGQPGDRLEKREAGKVKEKMVIIQKRHLDPGKGKGSEGGGRESR